MSVAVGSKITLEVTKVVHGGFGLARLDDFVVFVTGALPGEVVVAEVDKRQRKHAFARLWQVLRASTHRVEHFWEEADVSRPPGDRAGGADFGHMEMSFQHQTKLKIFKDCLVRMAGMETVELSGLRMQSLQNTSSGVRYRTRYVLHVDADGRAGPLAERTHTVVSASHLPLATQAIEDLGAHRKLWRGDHRLRLVQPTNEVARLVSPDTPRPITEMVNGFEFQLDDHVFWQVHHGAANTLSSTMGDLLSGLSVDREREHWDLFGGVGLFAHALSEWADPRACVVSVEDNRRASEYAERNLKPFPNALAVAAPTEGFLREWEKNRGARGTHPGVIIMDPPRKGAGVDVMKSLVRTQPQAVIYVACDPVSLARDSKVLLDSGYRVRSLQTFDLFPHTHHFESVVVFENGNQKLTG